VGMDGNGNILCYVWSLLDQGARGSLSQVEDIDFIMIVQSVLKSEISTMAKVVISL
jgi:hypothetical protein